DDARSLRETGEQLGVRPIVFAVHNTGIGENEARTLAQYADIVWGCASRYVREIVGKSSKVQIGVSIPVFAVSELGKKLVLNRAYHFEGTLVIHRASLPFEYENRQPKPLL
ncbi:MAG: DUF2099 family protein, partial [Methanomassiliicoccales archaeon]|nr:DUF2099 family protein [Methanomassiliicoccales archaeon]